MDIKDLKLIDIILAFSEAFDLIDKRVNNHHYNVAYLTYEFSKNLNIKGEKLNNLIIAALLHDIGCFKDSDKIKLLEFEYKFAEKHAINGYNLLKEFELLSNSAEYVKFHHKDWDSYVEKDETAFFSNIIFIADRIVILYRKNKGLAQLDNIEGKLKKEKGKIFADELVDLFIDKLKTKDEIWLNLYSDNLESILAEQLPKDFKKLNYDDVLKLGEFYAKLIDLKSRFTAIHSIGVSAIAEKLGQLLEVDVRNRNKLKLAGYLHDIGKLAVSNKIIDKKAQLTNEEFDIIREHPFYTYRLVNKIKEFYEIAEIASQHHETLSGNGYPFGLNLKKLSYNSRILAVADVFTALTEKRPYREDLCKEEVIVILKDMIENKKLDENIAIIAINEYDNLRKINLDKQKNAFSEFR